MRGKIELDKNIVETINEITNGLNNTLFLESAKNDLKKKLQTYIGEKKTDTLFVEGFDKINLSQKNLMNVLEVFYNFSKSENLNPKKIFVKGGTNFYNKEFKEKFIQNSNYNDDSVYGIRLLFSKTRVVEEEIGKDIYEFSKPEFDKLLYWFNAKTIRSLQNFISKINVYIKFTINQGVSDIDYMDCYSNRDKIEHFLDEEAKDGMIFSQDDIMEIADNADNVQDGVILALLFDGLSHKDKYAELVNLTRNMVDFDKKEIKLPRRIEGDNFVKARTISISNMTATLIERALKEDIYLSINGDKTRKYKIAQSNHVLRGVRLGRGTINWRNINQRILRLSEKNGEELLNATNVWYSGQVYYANKLLKEGVDIDDVVYQILKRFGIQVHQASFFYLKERILNNLN